MQDFEFEQRGLKYKSFGVIMKYKIGDRVKIKSLDWYNKNKDETGTVRIGPYFVERMSKYCGKEYFIKNVDDADKCYTLKNIIDWAWCDVFFEENKQLELE